MAFEIIEILKEEEAALQALEQGVRREMRVDKLPGKVSVVTGIRRCGKSFRLDQIKMELLTQGVAPHRIVSVRMADERWHPISDDLLTQIEDAYLRQHPVAQKDKVYWFFDEIQLAPHWELFIERMNRNRNYEIWLTGSSSHALSRDIATELRGRTLSHELFPFSFREFLWAQGLDASLPRSAPHRRQIQQAFDNYSGRGGFPEVTAIPLRLAARVMTEYYRTLLARDLIERHGPVSAHSIELALKTWTHQAGLPSTINRAQRNLKAIGLPVSVSQLAEYQNWIEDSYYLYRVSLFTDSIQKARVNPVKLYVVDAGFLRLTTTKFNGQEGRVLENLVYMELRRRHAEIFYYKTDGGQEIDFVLAGDGRAPELIQVCYDLSEPETRERELRALLAGMEELSVRHATVVTHGQHEDVTIGKRRVAFRPAWEYFLS